MKQRFMPVLRQRLRLRQKGFQEAKLLA